MRSIAINRERPALAGTLILLTLLLSACGAPRVKDGPPPGAAVPRAFPGDAVPRAEPRSRYGNGPYYRVHGATYKVLDSSYGYRERGVASWYGREFHGRQTSSQEPYDMYAMTAAHKTLPLPTYVRVRNLANNRSVVVRVNDRGPFVDNRLIDLSYAAARKLGMLKNGTSLVEVTAISFDDPPRGETRAAAAPDKAAEEPLPDGKPAKNRIFVQVGAFGEVDNARRRFSLLRDNGIHQVFVHEDRSANPALYRVRIGPIASVEQYDAIVERLKRIGIAETHLVSD